MLLACTQEPDHGSVDQGQLVEVQVLHRIRHRVGVPTVPHRSTRIWPINFRTVNPRLESRSMRNVIWRFAAVNSFTQVRMQVRFQLQIAADTSVVRCPALPSVDNC